MDLKKPRTFPTWVILVAVLIPSLVSPIVALAAATSVSQQKVFILNVTTTEPELKVDSYTAVYDILTNTYTEYECLVKNYGSTTKTSSLQIALFDSVGTVIAQGTEAITALAGSATTTITVSLTWTVGKTASDFATATLAIP